MIVGEIIATAAVLTLPAAKLAGLFVAWVATT
jgi:hypothetical protein